MKLALLKIEGSQFGTGLPPAKLQPKCEPRRRTMFIESDWIETKSPIRGAISNISPLTELEFGEFGLVL